MTDHEALGKLFHNSEAEARSLGMPAGSSVSLNNYLRLVLNLMNIYSVENEDERLRDVDCVWRLYCHQLNQQVLMIQLKLINQITEMYICLFDSRRNWEAWPVLWRKSTALE